MIASQKSQREGREKSGPGGEGDKDGDPLGGRAKRTVQPKGTKKETQLVNWLKNREVTEAKQKPSTKLMTYHFSDIIKLSKYDVLCFISS